MRHPLPGQVAALLAAALLLAPVLEAWAQTTQLHGVVNVNLATVEELQLLPGVGPAHAAAIVDYRKQNGPFKKVEDLTGVSGIGDKALVRMRPHCSLSGKTTASLSGPDS